MIPGFASVYSSHTILCTPSGKLSCGIEEIKKGRLAVLKDVSLSESSLTFKGLTIYNVPAS